MLGLMKAINKLIYYGIGTFGSKVIYFLLVPFYSFFLSKSELGIYDLILASLTIITPVITIQISEAVYRELLDPKRKTQNSSQIFSSGLSVVFIGLLLFVTACFFILYSSFYQLSGCLYFVDICLASCTIGNIFTCAGMIVDLHRVRFSDY